MLGVYESDHQTALVSLGGVHPFGAVRVDKLRERYSRDREKLYVVIFYRNLVTLKMVKELEADTSKADFDVELSKYPGKVVVVDFHATWCGPCKMIAPKLKQMEEEWKDKMVVLKVDVDDCADIAEKMGISAMPTFFIFKDGNKVGDVVGANEAKLRETISALF